MFAYIAPAPRASVKIIQGVTKAYKQPTSENASGKQVVRHFCGDCGTPLWAESQAAPDILFVKLAPFGNKLPPGADFFWKNAHGEHERRFLEDRGS